LWKLLQVFLIKRKSLSLMISHHLIPTLRSCEAEMDETVVMGCLDLEDQLAGMVSMERKERLEPLDHRDLLDPGVVGSLM
jgi:hypothetical protein